jgi:hypothetical protein
LDLFCGSQQQRQGLDRPDLMEGLENAVCGRLMMNR